MHENEERMEVYRDKDNEWRWRWIAANNKRIAINGEGLKNKDDLIEGALHVRGERDFPIIDVATGERLGAPVESLPGEVGERMSVEEPPPSM